MSHSWNKNSLSKKNLDELREICEELNTSASGKRGNLIKRIMEHGELSCASEQNRVNADSYSTLQMMMQMMKEQEENRMQMMKEQEENRMKEQEETRKLMYKFLESHSQTNNNNQNSDVTNGDCSQSDAILEKVNWFFEDIDSKMRNLEKDIENAVSEFLYRDAMKNIQKSVEKVNEIIAENLDTFTNETANQLQMKYREVNAMIQEKKYEI